jgi:flagellar motor switch protein FliM
MADILTQAEIEALLASMGSGEDIGGGPTTPVIAEPSPMIQQRADRRPVSYEVYDFRRPDKFSKEMLRKLQAIHENFARTLTGQLSTYLRTTTSVDLISAEQVPYDEYVRSLTSSLINVFLLTPLEGQAIFEIDLEVSCVMMDRLLGGPGEGITARKELTEIERSLVEQVTERVLAELSGAWSEIIDLRPQRLTMETSGQFVQIVPPSDIVVSLLFEIKVGDCRGAMSLCFPYIYLKPITGKLSSQKWYQGAKPGGSPESQRSIQNRIGTTAVPIVAELGRADISVRDLVDLEVGDIIVLKRKAAEPVELLVAGNAKFRGKPGLVGKKVAVQVLERLALES